LAMRRTSSTLMINESARDAAAALGLADGL
jgi:hypothetical protein